jgi:hypothetical protein
MPDQQPPSASEALAAYVVGAENLVHSSDQRG